MCDCGCNTCETKGPLLTEGKVKSLLSEGLQYHIDKKIPLFETVYRIGSDKHLSLIREARKMYSRNVIDLCEEDEALIKTNLGEFALYEGVSIPLDLPMLEEEVNNSDLDNAIYRLENVYKYLDTEYKETRRGEKFIQINYIPVTSPQSQNPEFVNVRYNNDEDIEMIKNRLGLSVLNESYDYDEVAQSEFGMDYDQLGSGEKEWVRDEIDNMSMNESDSNYPDFDLNKNIRYQDTSISSGMWRYTGKEQGGKGVYRNLNNGQILGFDRSDFDIFRKNLSSHFDFSESVNEDIYDKFLDNTQNPKGRAKSLILKFTKEYGDDASSMAVDRFSSKNNLKPEEKYILKYITKNDIKISSQSGGPDFSTLNEADDKLLKIKQELEALRPSISWIDDIFISSYDGSLQVELDYTLYPNEIKQLAQIAAKYGMELKYMTGKNATLVKRIDEAVKNALTEKKAKKKEKKDPPLNKPKRGGSKAYYVYVRDPKTKKIKKVSFGSGGLRAKIKNKEARNAFAARHNCKNKKDRTKAGYWSCNLPRYAPALGLGAKMNTFW